MTEEKLMDKHPFNPDWFVEKGLPVCSVMPQEYYDEMEAKESEGEEPEGEPKTEEPKGEPEEPEKPEEKTDEPKEKPDELMGKTREELDAIATEKGLDPSDYANKEEIAKAILESEE